MKKPRFTRPIEFELSPLMVADLQTTIEEQQEPEEPVDDPESVPP